jgi:predicted DCC family thiol-disulfide oxidoreductase YuxK
LGALPNHNDVVTVQRIFEILKAPFLIDLRSLALMRVITGFLLIYDLISRFMYFSTFYAVSGVLPRGAYIEEFMNRWHFSIHLAAGYDEWSYLLFLIHFVAAIALLFGYRTRTATVICWFLLVSLQNRNTAVLNGGDTLFRLLLFWAMFLPLGHRFSIDRALAPKESYPSDQKFFSMGGVGLTMQVVYMYFGTIFLKDHREWWPDGTASYYAMQLDAFTTGLGAWLSQFQGFLRIGTYIVFFIEIFAPLGILVGFKWPLVRIAAIGALIIMHLNFAATMRIGMFPFVDLAILCGLLPAYFWDHIINRFQKRDLSKVTIFYDGGCGFCRKSALILRTMLAMEPAPIKTAQEDSEAKTILEEQFSWIVRTEDGTNHTRFNGGIALLERSPLFFWFRFLPLKALTTLGDKFYNLIARNRDHLGKVTAVLFKEAPLQSTVQRKWAAALCLFFVGYMGLYNLKTIPEANITILSPWNRISSLLRIDQKWNMFAPRPTREDGWYAIPGELKDGTVVDVYRMVEGAPSEDRPKDFSKDYPTARWRKFMMNIWRKKHKAKRLYLGKFLCRRWNVDGLNPNKQLAGFKIIFYLEETPDLGSPPIPAVPHTIWTHDCFKRTH